MFSKFTCILFAAFLVTTSANAQKKIDCTNFTPMQIRQVDPSDCMSTNEVSRVREEARKNKLISNANSIKNDMPLETVIKIMGAPTSKSRDEAIWSNGKSVIWDGTKDGAVRFMFKDNRTYGIPNEGIISPAGQALYQKEKALAIEREKTEIEQERVLARNAVVTCDGKAMCSKLFSLVQIFVHSHSNQKIQLVTDTIIETYNPAEIGSIGMRAFKIPKNGEKEDISLEVLCKENQQIQASVQLCRLKRIDIYSQLKPFMDAKLLK